MQGLVADTIHSQRQNVRGPLMIIRSIGQPAAVKSSKMILP